MSTTIQSIEVSQFKVPEQFRSELGPEEDLRRLGENMLACGQLESVGALPNLELLYGFRRLAAAKLVGIKFLDARIFDRPFKKLEIHTINFCENMHRLDLSGYDKWKACEQMLNASPGLTAKELAQQVNMNPSAITKLLSPAKCIPEWQDALRAGEVGIGDCYQASLVPPEQQPLLLEMKRSGESRDGLSRAIRQTRPVKSRDSVKAARITISLGCGTKIVIRGRRMAMSDLVDTFVDCLEAARKGIKDQLDVKTWQCVMRDKAMAANGGRASV
jgi:ParB family transcriptional regulator, chromosome partitioning protein